MVKIGVDAISLTKNPSGVGKYLLGILQGLQQQRDFQIILFSNREIITDSIDLGDNIKLIVDNGRFSKIKSLVWLRYFSAPIIRAQKLDFFISNLGFFPKLEKGIKKIAIVHDLNYKIVPKTMGLTHFLAHFFWLKKDVRNADFVISNSLGTASKIKRFFHKSTDFVIHPHITKNQIKSIELDNTLKLPKNFILSVANMEPRKNLDKVIAMFESLQILPETNHLSLVLAGGVGWKNENLRNKISENRSIISLGYVSDADLQTLYGSAAVFVFPSIYEGFGIPVREAITYGCPVVASDMPELREAGNEDCIYINPNDIKRFSEAVVQALKKGRISPCFKLIDDMQLLIKTLYGSYIR